MELLVSWARSTVTRTERALSHADDYFDKILVGVLAILAVAIGLLFLQ
jgi:hypothetical protein